MTWCRDPVRATHVPGARGASGSRRAPGTLLLRVGVAVGLLRLFFRLRLGGLRRLLGGVGRLVGRVLLAEVDGLVVGRVGGGLVGVGEEEASSGTMSASSFRSCSMPWTMRLYSSSVRTAPIAFFAKRSSMPGPASRRTVSSLTSLTVAYTPPIVRTPVPGCMSLRIDAAACCLRLAERVIRNMAPMSTMNGRRVTIFTGRNFLRTTAAVSGLVDGGGRRRPQRRHRRSLSESTLMEQRSAWHRGS